METAGGVLTHNYGVGGESPADIQIALSVSDAAKTDTDPLVESLVSNTAAAMTPRLNTPAERDLSAKSPEPEPVAKQLFAKVVSIEKVTGDIVSTYKLLYEVLPHDSISHFLSYIVLCFQATLDIGASTEADMSNNQCDCSDKRGIGASTEADMSNQCVCFDKRRNCQANYKAPLSPWEIAKNAGLEVKLEATCPAIAKIFDAFHGIWMFCDGDDGHGHDVVSQFRAKLTQESLSGEKPDYDDPSLYLNMNKSDKVPSNYLVLGIPAGGYREVRTQLFERASVNEALEIRSAYAELFFRDKKEFGRGHTTWNDVSKVRFCAHCILSYLIRAAPLITFPNACF